MDKKNKYLKAMKQVKITEKSKANDKVIYKEEDEEIEKVEFEEVFKKNKKENTGGTTQSITNNNTNCNTKSILKLKKKAKPVKQSFSLKIKKENADKMITFCKGNEINFTDLIEHCLEIFLDENEVVADEEIVKEYELSKKSK